ncbi:MAG: orotidine-5'-phosphate decarboxylase [Acidobacteriota bacterium]
MRDRIIIALDFDRFEVAKNLVGKLEDAVFFKVGLQAYIKYGDQILTYLKKKKKKIFLDLKFKDIPNTVFWAVKSSLKYDPDFLTIHLSGGREMVEKAILAASEKPGLKVLGVTVLTSLGDEDLKETGVSLDTESAVLKLCEMGIKAGLTSFVCSPKEIEPIKKNFGRDITLVTPGIRPKWASGKGDQKRVFTPEMAVEAGSDYIVVGRPITASKDPVGAFGVILNEITSL